MDEVVVAVHELLRLLGSPEQRRDPPPARVHVEGLVGPALAAVEILADDLRGAREGLARLLGLGHELRALRDVLDHHHARAVVAGDTRRDDRGKALAILAAEHDVELALAVAGHGCAVPGDLVDGLLGPVRQRPRGTEELLCGEARDLAHPLVDARDPTVRGEEHESVLQGADHRLRDLPCALRFRSRLLGPGMGAAQRRGQPVHDRADEREPRRGHEQEAKSLGRVARIPAERARGERHAAGGDRRGDVRHDEPRRGARGRSSRRR